RIFDSGARMPDPETFGEYQLSYRSGDIVSPRIEATEPLSLELADFAKAIVEGTPLVSSPEVGLDVVRTIEAVDRSLAEGGGPVTLGGGASLTELEEDLHSRIGEFKAEDVKSAPSPVAENGETIGTAILGGGPAG